MIFQLGILFLQIIIMFATLWNLNEATTRDKHVIACLKQLNDEWFRMMKDLNKLPGDEWKNQ